MTPTELADMVAEAAADKKARDVLTVDLAGELTATPGFRAALALSP